MKRLMDYDPFTKVSTYHEYDDTTKKTIIESVQDVDPILELNKAHEGKLNKKENWWFVGTIPNVVIMQWSQECGHPPYSKEWTEYAKKQQQLTDYRKLNVNKVRF